MNTEFNGYCNYETEYIADNVFAMHTPDMYPSADRTVKSLADELQNYMITQIESSSFGEGTAREVAYRFIEEVDFEEIADRMIEDNS
jgi:hypothetical protein